MKRWRHQFIASCHRQGVQIEMGKNVQFFHQVEVYGVGGKITLEDGVQFAFNEGAHWLGPVGIEIRRRDAELVIGRGSIIMRATRLVCFKKIILGPECGISDGCLLIDSNGHDLSPGNFHVPDPGAPIQLGQRVRLGPDVTILKGVVIGDDAMIGTRSVVMANLPERCVAMGNPARVLHQYAADNAAARAKPAGA